MVSSIRSNRVVIGGDVRPATVVFEEERIVAIGSGMADADFGDLVILPGLVDTHVHVNEPGRTEWEGFAAATRAALAGGTTTIVDMPLNSIPPTVDLGALRQKQVAAQDKISVDVAFWGGLIPGSSENLGDLARAGVCGFKAFLVDSGVDEFPPIGLEELRSAMRFLAEIELPVLLHAEDPASLVAVEGPDTSYQTYLASRPASSEAAAVRNARELAVSTGAPTHILHVSSGEAASEIGPGMSGETCPHYLVLCAEEIADGATAFKCAPPIRSQEVRETLWEALQSGSLSMVVSDHSPAPASLKSIESGDFIGAWGGIGSLQLRLNVTWDAASQRGVTLPELARWLAEEPANLAGLGHRKGSINEGKDADFVVFDPEGTLEVRGSALQHRHPITPFEGMTLRGSVVRTVLRGRTIYEQGVITGSRGRLLERDG